jgi:hypothetical protein
VFGQFGTRRRSRRGEKASTNTRKPGAPVKRAETASGGCQTKPVNLSPMLHVVVDDLLDDVSFELDRQLVTVDGLHHAITELRMRNVIADLKLAGGRRVCK